MTTRSRVSRDKGKTIKGGAERLKGNRQAKVIQVTQKKLLKPKVKGVVWEKTTINTKIIGASDKMLNTTMIKKVVRAPIIVKMTSIRVDRATKVDTKTLIIKGNLHKKSMIKEEGRCKEKTTKLTVFRNAGRTSKWGKG